jgi:hypothetical protein
VLDFFQSPAIEAPEHTIAIYRCGKFRKVQVGKYPASGELSEDIVDDTWDGTRRVDIDTDGKIFPGMMVAEYQRPLGRLEARLIRPPI